MLLKYYYSAQIIHLAIKCTNFFSEIGYINILKDLQINFGTRRTKASLITNSKNGIVQEFRASVLLID